MEAKRTVKNIRLRVRVKEIAEQQGYDMSSLSRASDISFKTIKRLWQHPEANVLMSTIKRLADTLGISPLDFFEVELSTEEET